MPRLARLVRYPLKGFAGQELDRTALRVGGGLPGDRSLALADGRVPVDPEGGWTRCEAFVRLTTNPDLPLFRLAADERDLTLVSPDGEELTIALDNPAAAGEVLAGWFPSSSTRLVRADAGYWDHEDAHVSLINLETVHALSDAAGQSLDPLRFRGNLYLQEMPAWEELGLVGHRIRIGEAELDVLRPIDRCRATSINPVTAGADMNVPLLLGREFGHIFCGVYAKVAKGGPLAPGAPVVDLGRNAAAAAVDATQGGPAQWPRPARIVSRSRESRDVVSLWLSDPLAGRREASLPGQHVRVHGRDDDGPLWRSYTVSATDGDLLRISVKRDGRMSALLHSTADPVLISGPFGHMTLPEADDGPLLMASAGIGITPMIAMLRACADRGSTRRVTLLHGARDGRALALWPEAEELVQRLPNGEARLFLSRPEPGDIAAYDATEGRVDLGVLTDAAQLAAAHLCGPPAFMRQAKSALIAAGADPGLIHYELFTSPDAAHANAVKPPAPGPFTVHFAASGVRARWDPDAGSLLDLAEAQGLQPRAACRSGACRSCLQTVSAGTAAYLSQPLASIPADSVLLCSAVPTSDLTIQC
ncbi:MOSC domain-containing protein [Streptomyces sp. TRM49041]|uniref:MOSC domain-containing protein n=1 Tax=Streptomyces sp. TRM49041 TaxID=2603216 RepID=UPI0011ED2F62|nr:MOSC domain-containing protein [Streptomyces sp. TRM49041]